MQPGEKDYNNCDPQGSLEVFRKIPKLISWWDVKEESAKKGVRPKSSKARNQSPAAGNGDLRAPTRADHAVGQAGKLIAILVYQAVINTRRNIFERAPQ